MQVFMHLCIVLLLSFRSKCTCIEYFLLSILMFSTLLCFTFTLTFGKPYLVTSFQPLQRLSACKCF